LVKNWIENVAFGGYSGLRAGVSSAVNLKWDISRGAT
jgi:hypothetical protein